MDRTYFSSLLELWELDDSEVECSTLLNATASWAGYTHRGEVDETAAVIARVASANTTAVSGGSAYGGQEEGAGCRVALGEVKLEEGRKEHADERTEGKQEQTAFTDGLEDTRCGLEEDSENDLKGLEGKEVLEQSLEGCTSWVGSSVPGKVGEKSELLGGELVCVCCKHCNDIGTHWCSECGTSLLATSSIPTSATSRKALPFRHETESLSNSSGNTQLQFPSSSPCEVSVSSCSAHDSFDDQDPAQGSTLDCVLEDCEQEGDTTQICRESGNCREYSYPVDRSTTQTRQMHETRGRYWSTSRMYHWRKPSSLKPADISPLGKPKPSNTIIQVSQEDSGNMRSTSPFLFTTSPYHLLCLPTELLLAILSYLTQSEVARCMLVCRRVYQIASDPTLWNTVVLCKRRAVTDEILLNIGKRMPRILRIVHSSGNISIMIVQRFFGLMPKLQELTIDTCNFGPSTGDQLLISASLHCSQLNSVDIRWTHLSDRAFIFFIQNCKSLKKIRVEQIPQVSMMSFYLLIKKHKSRLTHVGCHGKMSFNFRSLVTWCASEGIVCPNVVQFYPCSGQVDQLKVVFPNLQMDE